MNTNTKIACIVGVILLFAPTICFSEAYEYALLRVVENKTSAQIDISKNYDHVKIQLETRSGIKEQTKRTITGLEAKKIWDQGVGSKEIAISDFVKKMGWKLGPNDSVGMLALLSVMGEHGYRLINERILHENRDIIENNKESGEFITTQQEITGYLFEIKK